MNLKRVGPCKLGCVWVMSAVMVMGLFSSAPVIAKKGVGQVIVTTIKSGLNNPRGLKFGPDGNLYVAEGGVGGLNPVPSDGSCARSVPLESGIAPYTGNDHGSRILQIGPLGTTVTWVDGLPSSQTAGPGFISGVADVAFVGDTMYFVLAGAGCSHGVTVPNIVGRVNNDLGGYGGAHSWTQIADLSAFARANLLPEGTLDDEEPDGTWYSMIALRGDLYTVEPNRGLVVKVTTRGTINIVTDVNAHYGHIVPTALAYHGNFYLGNLDEFGIPSNSSNIFKITPSGNIKIDTAGFTTVVGLVFDGPTMYVLEQQTDSLNPFTKLGDIVRVDPSGRKEVIVQDLLFPTAMTMGPDGNLYVSNHGFDFGPASLGAGEILKVEIH